MPFPKNALSKTTHTVFCSASCLGSVANPGQLLHPLAPSNRKLVRTRDHSAVIGLPLAEKREPLCAPVNIGFYIFGSDVDHEAGGSRC